MENKKVEFKLLHVGINCVDGEEAKKTAEQFSQAMGFDISENPSSLFAGTSVEIMEKNPIWGVWDIWLMVWKT